MFGRLFLGWKGGLWKFKFIIGWRGIVVIGVSKEVKLGRLVLEDRMLRLVYGILGS